MSPTDHKRLLAIASDRNRQRKHAERAQIVLASADRAPVQQIAAQLGVSRPMVWRWQQRFAQAGVERYLEEHNAEPRPFVWTASAASIIAKLDRLPAPSD